MNLLCVLPQYVNTTSGTNQLRDVLNSAVRCVTRTRTGLSLFSMLFIRYRRYFKKNTVDFKHLSPHKETVKIHKKKIKKD